MSCLIKFFDYTYFVSLSLTSVLYILGLNSLTLYVFSLNSPTHDFGVFDMKALTPVFHFWHVWLIPVLCVFGMNSVTVVLCIIMCTPWHWSFVFLTWIHYPPPFCFWPEFMIPFSFLSFNSLTLVHLCFWPLHPLTSVSCVLGFNLLNPCTPICNLGLNSLTLVQSIFDSIHQPQLVLWIFGMNLWIPVYNVLVWIPWWFDFFVITHVCWLLESKKLVGWLRFRIYS